MSTIKFEPVREAYTHGYRASCGMRAVEVLRSYPGDWFVCAVDAGKLCKARSDEKRPMSYADAMRDARRFLNREITWEVWT
jgi:predicted outer membrane protein